MADMRVRQATLKDMEAVLDLWQEMMGYHARLDPRFRPAADGRELFREVLQEWMVDETCRILVAEDDGQVVGYIIGRLAENPAVFKQRYLGHVSDICVAPDRRRTGVGRKLFGFLRKWFRGKGLTVAQLNVAALNPVSQAFWREMGFQDYMQRLWLEM
jgi:ribosomal protein S18 acetylase RimI-like enzyme